MYVRMYAQKPLDNRMQIHVQMCPCARTIYSRCVYIYTHTDAITFTYMRIHTPCKSLASRKPWALPVGLGLSDLGHLRFCLVLAAKGFRAGFLRDLKEDIGVQRFSMLTLALSENFQHD